MEVILHIGIAQFAFAILLVLTKERKQLADNILGLWLGLMVIFMVLTLLKEEMASSFWAQLQLFPFFFTIGPFLYLYVRTLAAAKPKLEFYDSLHLLPFVIFSVSAVTLDTPVDEGVLEGNSFQLNFLFYSISALISIYVYFHLTIQKLNQHRKNLLDHFSYTSRRISLSWLRVVTLMFITTIALTLVSSFVNVSTSEMTLNPGIFLFMGFTAFAFAVTFFGVQQPAIFQRGSGDERFVDTIQEESGPESAKVETEVAEADSDNENEQNGRYARSGLSQEDAEKNRDRLMLFMESQKPWLRRDLTIQDVATELDIPQHHLTQTINELLGKNFYTLVNEFRVEEVKKQLLNPKYDHFTVLALAHDAGFNSKSSFNMTFKKYVGMTPTQFRKAQRLS